MAISIPILFFCFALCLMMSYTSANRPVFYDQYYPPHPPYYRGGQNKVIQVHHYTDGGRPYDHDRYYHHRGGYPRYYSGDYDDHHKMKGDSNKLMELLLLSALMNNARGGNNQGPFLPGAARQGGVLPGGALIG